MAAVMLTAGTLHASVTVSPTSLNFGSVTVGTTTTAQTVTFTNNNTSSLTFTSITITGDFSKSGNCPKSPAVLAAGASCTMNIKFTPTAVGTRTGTLTFNDSDSSSPQNVSLTGVGTSAGGVTVSPTSLNFGSVIVGTTSSAQNVTLTNNNSTALSLTSITITGDFSKAGSCGHSLAAGASCIESVKFTPTATGTRTGTLTFTDSDASSPQTVSLTGTGTQATGVVLNPPSLTFTSVEPGFSSTPQTITVLNANSTSIDVVSVFASGDFNQTNTCPTTLGAGASCVVTVTFVPSAVGTRAGFVTVSDTDSTNLQTANLTGTGAIPQSSVTLSPKFASVTPTQTATFAAKINGMSSNRVNWSVDGVAGGNSTVGTISNGVYTPPSTAGSHTIQATSKTDSSKFAHAQAVVTDFPGTFTYRNDGTQTGQNPNELVLTSGNVNSTQFGKLFSFPIDGQAYAEPLYVPAVNIPGQGVRNVIYVATEHDSVYAFDADNLTSTPYWQVSFINPSAGINTLSTTDVSCSNITPEIGITATPVIDPLNQTLYVAVRTKETVGTTTNFFIRLHALDITTGAEKSGSPATLSGSVPGTGEGGNGTTVTFNSQLENARTGLTLLNGVVYIGVAAMCDIHPYHGWMFGYDENTLQQTTIFNTTPNGKAGGVWQGGMVTDGNGDLYITTGQGPFDVNKGGNTYGDTYVKFNTAGGLTVSDWFTPFNQATLNQVDDDLAASGPLLLPDQPTNPTHLLVGSGKAGDIYLLNRDNMGHYNSTDNSQIVQYLPAALGVATEDNVFSHPGYFQNQVYYAAVSDFLKTYRLHSGLLSTTPITQSPVGFNYPGATPIITSNGTSQAVLWTIEAHSNMVSGPAILHAHDASNVARELYNSTQAGTRDTAGGAVKFTIPTVANGRVYIGTASEVDVYGLLPQ